MENNSIITIVKPIESFAFYYEIQRTGFVSDKVVSGVESTIDFEPDALKYIEFECFCCDHFVLYGIKHGGSIMEGYGACIHKRLNWTNKFNKSELELVADFFNLNILLIENENYIVNFKCPEVSEEVIKLLYKRCPHCNSEYVMLYAEVGKHMVWEYVGDHYIHGIWQVELSPEFREKHFKPQAKPS